MRLPAIASPPLTAHCCEEFLWQEKTGCSSKIEIIGLIFNCHFLRSKPSIFIESSLRDARSQSKWTNFLFLVCLQLYRLKRSRSNPESTKTKSTNVCYECSCRNLENRTLFAVKLHLCRKRISETKSLLVFRTWDSCWLCFCFWMLLGSTGRCITVVP